MPPRADRPRRASLHRGRRPRLLAPHPHSYWPRLCRASSYRLAGHTSAVPATVTAPAARAFVRRRRACCCGLPSLCRRRGFLCVRAGTLPLPAATSRSSAADTVARNSLPQPRSAAAASHHSRIQLPTAATTKRRRHGHHHQWMPSPASTPPNPGSDLAVSSAAATARTNTACHRRPTTLPRRRLPPCQI